MEAILEVKFFANSLGTEPVRDWLKSLTALDRKTIGEDIKTVQLGWPLGAYHSEAEVSALALIQKIIKCCIFS